MTQDIVILDGARTAIGAFGGKLAGTRPSRSEPRSPRQRWSARTVEPAQIGHVVFGHVINAEPRECTSRVAPQWKPGSQRPFRR